MIILIAGGTHTGKTLLAQRILEQRGYPYLSIDHLKMGLIRSGWCGLTPESADETLTETLWPIIREMAKTAIENGQNLTVEGCYIPFAYRQDFTATYLCEIHYVCLIFSERYIRAYFEDIERHACAIERRQDDSHLSPELLLAENRRNLKGCREYGLDYILIEDRYEVAWDPDIPRRA